MYLRTLEIYFLKYINSTLLVFCTRIAAQGLAWQAASRNTKIILDLLTDIDMLLMVEKCV